MCCGVFWIVIDFGRYCFYKQSRAVLYEPSLFRDKCCRDLSEFQTFSTLSVHTTVVKLGCNVCNHLDNMQHFLRLTQYHPMCRGRTCQGTGCRICAKL